jgi:hypothetical protein
MVSAVEKVKDRLLRATAALRDASVPYAVVGGNAVAAWVTRVDEAAVRNTQDVDILLRREDLAAAVEALEEAGFVFRHVAGMDVFLDGPNAKARDAVHVVFAGEKVRPHEAMLNPDVMQSEEGDDYRVLSLEALVQIKLTAFRRKDQVHLLDLLSVGLIDQSWTARYPVELAERLQLLIDDPDG